jgi:hypothetical protein
MPCIYMLALRCKDDDTRYYKLGYLSNGNAPDRMHYSDSSNVPLTTYFDLVDHCQWDTPDAKKIEELVHHKIRNEWNWKCDGVLGIHRKHKYFPQLFSGVTECRVYDKDEVRAVYRCIKEALDL